MKFKKKSTLKHLILKGIIISMDEDQYFETGLKNGIRGL
jgi:hypothetical protein